MTRTKPDDGLWTLSDIGTALRFGAFPAYAHRWWHLTGDAKTLAWCVVKGQTPVGILLDRLEEYPEECAAPVEVVAEAVRQLRERNPLGTETNW